MAKRKIVLFGGTFDPIHLGHTAVAAAAVEDISAEEIIFIPAKCSPLKKLFPRAGDNDRLEMTALAISGNEKFRLSDYELKKSRPGYTLETVRKFQADYGSDASIYWLIGADNMDDLPHWYRITDLIDRCNLCVMHRAGCEAPDFTRFGDLWGDERVEKLKRNIVKTPLVDVSSTEIRRRLAAGLDVSGMLHPAVAEYIRRHGLYKSQ